MSYSFQIEVHRWQPVYFNRQRNDSIRYGSWRLNLGWIDFRYMWMWARQ